MANNGSEKPVDLRKIYVIVRKNWMVMWRDKARLVPLMLMPLLMIVVFGYTTGAPVKHIPTAIVDYDNSNLSHAFESQLRTSDLFSFGREVGSQDEGRKLIDSGKVKALFVIPAGFEQSILDGRTATISMIVDESDPTVAATTKAAAQILAQGLSGGLTQERVAGLIPGMQGVSTGLAQAKGVLAPATIDKDRPHYTAIAASAADFARNFPITRATAPLQNPYSAQYSVFDIYSSNMVLLSAQSRVASDMQSAVSESGAITANSAANRGRARAAIEVIDSASGAVSSLADAASMAAAVPISLSFIEPYGNGRRGIDFLIPSILALTIFQGATMGLGRAIAGERRDGSLTRVFMTPTSSATILIGTQMFYLMLETMRSTLIVLSAVLLFGVSITGNPLDIFVVIAIFALGVTGIGMIISVIAKTQEQYMALAALVSLPAMFLAGVFFPIQTMPPFFQGIASILPLSYAADALRGIMIKGFTLGQVFPDLVFLTVFGIITIGVSLMLFKREMI